MNPYYNSEADLLETLNQILILYGNNTEENKEQLIDLAREFHNFDLNKTYALSSESFLVDRVRDWHQSYDKFSLENIREGLLAELERHRPISYTKRSAVKKKKRFIKFSIFGINFRISKA